MEFTSFTHTQYRRQDNESTHFSSVCSALGLRRFGWGWRLCCLTWFLRARLDGGRSLFGGDIGHSDGADLVDLIWSGRISGSLGRLGRSEGGRDSAGGIRRQSRSLVSPSRLVLPGSPGTLSEALEEGCRCRSLANSSRMSQWCGLVRLKVRLLKSASHC